MKIALVGAGRGAIALGVLWERAGHEVILATGRSEATQARVSAFLPNAAWFKATYPPELTQADVILIGAPDDAIGTIASAVTAAADVDLEGTCVAHLSGALGLEPLDPARARGATPLALHPLQTLPTVEAAIERLPGSAVAVTADDEETAALGEQLAADAGAVPFRLSAEAKPLYHAAAVFASNHVVALIAQADVLFEQAGVPDALDRFMPLVRATVDNVGALGPEAALTGPAARGDAGTVARNLEALAEASPQAVASYVALAEIALDLAVRSGKLDPAARAPVDEVLTRWR